MTKSLSQWPLAGMVVEQFPMLLDYFDANCPFTRFGQLEFHRETIERRREVGSAASAMTDEAFLKSLYRTLQAWGIGSRASRLKPFGEFSHAFRFHASAIEEFDGVLIDDSSLDANVIVEQLWPVLDQLSIVDNSARLVPVTKALHHVLPDLVVPMDRAYTQVFFGWQNPQFQYGQRQRFAEAFGAFAQIARVVRPAQYVGSGWRTSRTKLIDNAIVGAVQVLKATVRSGAG